MNNTCKDCIFNHGIIANTDRIYCEYIDDDTNNNRCEYFEEIIDKLESEAKDG